MATLNLITVGLLYDIFGAILLIRALCFATTGRLFAESGTYWGGNLALFKTLLLQRYDARFGLSLIVSGFLFQIFGSLKLVLSPTHNYVLLILLSMAVGLYLIWRIFWARQAPEIFKKHMAKTKEKS